MITKLFIESVVLSDYKKYAKAVAHAYKARPLKESSDKLRSWDVLKRHNYKMFKRLQSRIEVKWTDDDPYESADEMKRKVLDTKVMYVTTQHADNLMINWKPEDMWVFRAVHDYVVHIGGNHDFSLKGEISAFNTHSKIAPPDSIPALFSEVVGQVCFFYTFGKFPDPQKACVLYGFDYDRLGEINWEAYKTNFTKDPIKNYPEREIENIIKKVKF